MRAVCLDGFSDHCINHFAFKRAVFVGKKLFLKEIPTFLAFTRVVFVGKNILSRNFQLFCLKTRLFLLECVLIPIFFAFKRAFFLEKLEKNTPLRFLFGLQFPCDVFIWPMCTMWHHREYSLLCDSSGVS